MNASDDPTITPETSPKETLYIPPRQQPSSAAKLRKRAARAKMQRTYSVVGKPGALGKIGGTEYVVGPSGNIQRTSANNQKDRKPTRRGKRR